MSEGFLERFHKLLRPLIEEWFQLMEWLLVISALAFAAKVSANIYVQIFTYISMAALWVYTAIVYVGRFFGSLAPIPKHERSKPRLALRFGVILFVSGAIILLTLRVTEVAREFASVITTKP